MIVTQIVVQNEQKSHILKCVGSLVFLKIQKIDDIKLKWLQMRIVHRITSTNVVLKKMGIINCEQCNYVMKRILLNISCGSTALPDAFGDY